MNNIQTFTGKMYDFMAPTTDMVCLTDIAMALSRMCRFGGHCEKFYSIAEHSVLVSYLTPPSLALEGLMHDAPEAYCNDIVTGLKCLLDNYSVYEDRADQAIMNKFNLDFGKLHHPDVKSADMLALAIEYRDNMKHLNPGAWDLPEIPSECEYSISCWTPEEASAQFTNRFAELYIERVRA
ncbi:MAG: hypothetical protein H0X04_00255 [Chthoniobacterales bacterium]|nr:hypothetical protein [Chthoniobacterales bacterium]